MEQHACRRKKNRSTPNPSPNQPPPRPLTAHLPIYPSAHLPTRLHHHVGGSQTDAWLPPAHDGKVGVRPVQRRGGCTVPQDAVGELRTAQGVVPDYVFDSAWLNKTGYYHKKCWKEMNAEYSFT